MKKSKKGFISMTLVYTFLILFMFLMLAVLRTYNEKNKFLEAVNEQINNDIGNANKTKATILNKMLDDNLLQSDNSLLYFKISNSNIGNGNGLFYMDNRPSNIKYSYDLSDLTDEDTNGHTSRIYYYRGNVENNHLIFSGMCFRIVRTNEDGSIRLRYNGIPKDEGGKLKCPRVEDLLDTSLGFNASIGSSTTTVDFSSSPVKQQLYTWYENNILGKIVSGERVLNVKSNGEPVANDVSENSIFCNNKKSYSEKPGYYESYELAPEYIKNASGAYENIDAYDDLAVKNIIRFKCEQASDRFKLDNNRLSYPVGLLTAQDVVLAGGYLLTDEDVNCTEETCIYQYLGGNGGTENTNYYLYTPNAYWTMTPYNSSQVIYVNGENLNVNITESARIKPKGAMYEVDANTNISVIPVISLKPNVSVAKGNGNYDNPYIVRY